MNSRSLIVRDHNTTGSESAKQVVITAADSLVDRYSDKVSFPRSEGRELNQCLGRLYQELGRIQREGQGERVLPVKYGRALPSRH